MRFLALFLAVALAPLTALDIEIEDPWAEFEVEPLPTGGIIPARSQAVGFAKPAAYRFDWDEYRTLVVISPGGKGKRSTAWVVTADKEGNLAVAYRAIAFRDAAGLVHIDARKALLSGPMAKDGQWSPDSFAITPEGRVHAIDDRNSANSGTVIETFAPDTPDYDKAYATAVATVRETS